jgi:putative endonuclease
MFYVYILLLSNATHYTGITNNLTRRFIEHNQGKSISTRHHRPVILKFSQKFKTRDQARAKEVYIKNMGAKRFLNKLKFSPTPV